MSSDQEIFHLVYRSIAEDDLTQKGIDGILRVSHKLNRKAGISGILIKRGKVFLQLLEGPKNKVLTTFRRIHQDPRHHSIKTVIETKSSDRLYSNWDMAYVEDADEHAILEELIPFLDEATSFADNSKEAIMPTLKIFSEKLSKES
ncbi:BLUF domain-containing protein [bacterium]|nr:BLUF domain-containing protein [bacterium]